MEVSTCNCIAEVPWIIQIEAVRKKYQHDVNTYFSCRWTKLHVQYENILLNVLFKVIVLFQIATLLHLMT